MEDFEKKIRDALGEELRQNVVLSDLVSMKVGGVADFYFVAKKIDDLVKAVMTARDLNLPYFILGGGYNIIPSDTGFPGLVIKNECGNIAFSEDTSEVIVDSGLHLGKLINLSASRELGGLEFLFGIPGTVGGAVYGNAGAFDHQIGDYVKSVILLVPKDGKMVMVKKEKEGMNFSYRSSKLKEEYGGEKYKPVILTVKLQLVRRRRDEILSLMQQYIKQKKDSQPLEEASAGSFFRNAGKERQKSAGYLLDQVGAKKIRIGGAAFSRKHANFLINRKNASASDIRRLADKAKGMVREKFNIELEEEIEYIGKW